MWLARVLGAKIVTHDGPFEMVAYRWRGRLYVWSFGEQVSRVVDG
jgi:hypothetical protein